MRSFEEIYSFSCMHHGKDEMRAHLEASKPKSSAELAAIPDDRWLSMATKCIFQAGFNWKIIEAKWDGFENAFDRFDLGRWIFSSDDDIADLLSDTRIVRNGQKISSVPENAKFFAEMSDANEGFGSWIANSSSAERNLLLTEMHQRGSRLGAMTGQYFLRFMGADSYILSRDVTAALVREGVVDKQPTSQKAMMQTQSAFNQWMDESGYGLTQISRVLARSIG